jgi:hypothetical protein
MEFPESFDAPDPSPEPPKHIMSEPMDEDHAAANRTSVVEASPMASVQDRVAADVVSLETVRSALVSNFEQNDLDVPAFLRKRNDVM